MMYFSASKNRTIVRSRNAVRLTRAALQTAYVVSEDLGTSFAERLFTTPRRHARPDRERAVLATARELVVDVTHPTLGAIKALGSPIKMSATPPDVRRRAPLLGEHTEEVLSRSKDRAETP